MIYPASYPLPLQTASASLGIPRLLLPSSCTALCPRPSVVPLVPFTSMTGPSRARHVASRTCLTALREGCTVL
ncbi:hypothetical protein LY78DRAFT_655618, partial [Colletotrichum sublineola]